jgi:MFS family permease
LHKTQGWISAAAASFLMFAAGNFQYIFGVFVPPLVGHFGWTRAEISWSVTIRNIVSSITMPVAGSLADRSSVKKYIIAGIFIVGLSYFLCSRISSLWQLYGSVGILTGAGISLLVIPTVATISRWFGKKAAIPNGIVYAGFGLALMALPPIATWVILRYSWQVCFTSFSVLAIAGGTLSWFFIKEAPELPEQTLSTPAQPYGDKNPIETVSAGSEQWTFSSASRTRALWSLVLINVVVGICFQIIAIHIVAAAIDEGIAAQAAAVILTFIGFTNTAGRLIVSSLAIKFGNKTILVVCLAIQCVLLFFLAGAGTLPVFLIIGGIYGLFYGGIPPMMPTVTAEYFGTKSFGRIFSVVNMAYNIGAAIGPLAAGYIFDITGRYYLAFMSGGIAMALALVLGLALRTPQMKRIY